MGENEQTKRKMIEAALSLFSEKGFHGTKISDIVKKAGLAQGTFYLYFKNKEALFNSIMEDHMRQMIDTLEQLKRINVQPCGREELHRHLFALFIQLLQNFCNNKVIVRTLDLHGMNSSEVQKLCSGFRERLSRLIMEQLKRFGFCPECTEEQLEIAAYASMGMVYQVAHKWFVERDKGPEAVKPLAGMLAEMHLRLLYQDGTVPDKTGSQTNGGRTG